jgi:dephospho-CoA kinase
MRVIGLTGGIASGKSCVARIISDMGVPVIDADQLARDVVLPGMPALAAIAGQIGNEVINPDGTLNRELLAAKVFGDPSMRRLLEGIMHPAIKTLAEGRLETLRAGGSPIAVYMAPLLIEAGATDRVDEIWVVYVDHETQLYRVMKRDGLQLEEAEERLAAQMPMEEKRLHGRIVIDNLGTTEELETKVLEIFNFWKTFSFVEAELGGDILAGLLHQRDKFFFHSLHGEPHGRT